MKCAIGLQLTILALVSAFVFSAVAQTVYKVVQEDGTVLYTDQPIPGAKPMDLSTVNSAVMPRLAVPQPQPVDATQPEGPVYTIDVVAPAPEATIRDNNGRVAIFARLAPKASGQFHLWLNNQRAASADNGSFMLEGLNRGAHTFFITVTDNTGKTLASSDPQTFYLHQASALINRTNNP